MTKLENVEKAIKKETKIIWFETPTNPTMKIIDIEGIVALAKKNNLLTVADNTYCTPYLQSPLLLGCDIVFHSLSKYMGGHSDVVMGTLVMKD